MGTQARSLRVAAILISAGLGVAGCTVDASGDKSGHGKQAPATLETIAGSDVKKVVLTDQAAKRLGIQTVTIGAPPAPTATPTASAGPTPSGRPTPAVAVVPYSAVLYDPDGRTWVYTVPQPLTYVREQVVVTTVSGANGTEAVLSAAPPAGTTIVSTGVVELYGTELKVGQ